MIGNAVIIGNSDGIGLGATQRLLEKDWKVVGLSRSESPITHALYEHIVVDVRVREYTSKLSAAIENLGPVDLCIYCAGIGELLDLSSMETEAEVIDVNLIGMVKTASRLIPGMVERKKGHFIGISSVADELLSPEAPSYHASKAGFSNYLEGLALNLKSRGVNVSNVRFGFVDTKMAKGDVKPFMISAERAVEHLMKCMEKKPIRYTAPRIVLPLLWFRRWMLRLSVLFD